MKAAIDAYFDRLSSCSFSGMRDLELNFLRQDQANTLTESFLFHPVVCHLNGLVLDDPGTSNYHVLLRRPPLEGHVLFLPHDNSSRVVFPSLPSLLDAAEEARSKGIVLPDLHAAVSPQPTDQVALSELISGLVDQEEIDVVLALIPSMDLEDAELLAKLVSHADFFLGESVAAEIAKRPSSALRPIATLCAKHLHSQVARAGMLALKAISA